MLPTEGSLKSVHQFSGLIVETFKKVTIYEKNRKNCVYSRVVDPNPVGSGTF
jgi:hypothetical protein